MECREFRVLLLLLRGELTDAMIPHRTKLRELIIEVWRWYFQVLKCNLLVPPFSLSTLRGSGPLVGGKQVVYGGVLVRNVHGNLYLDMKLATESEVADTEGSTATGAPLSKSEMGEVRFHVCPHTTILETETGGRSVGGECN